MKMKIINRLYFLLITALILTACESESSSVNSNASQIYFSIQSLKGEIDEAWNTRSVIPNSQEPIKQLHYVVLDGNNQIITPRWQKLAQDFSFLALEGLSDGDYSVAFFATTSNDTEIIKPVIKNDKLVLENGDKNSPLNTDYLFDRIDFKVNKENGSRTIEVQLKRNVGRVEVEVNPTVPYTAYQIQKVEINLASGSEVYLSCTSDGNDYAGSGTITAFDVTKDRGFYSLPSKMPLSGTATIQSIRQNGEKVIDNYHFSNISIEAGKISKIKIDWVSSDSNKGFFYVSESDYTIDNEETMFLNNEPREVFYDASLRSFSSNEPLQVRINSDKKLQVKLYAPIDLRDVTILCRFRKYSNEFFPLARYEVIKAFSHSQMNIPVVDKTLTFTSKDGRNVLIPAQPNLKNEDCEFKIESNHPYMKKIEAIKYPISIRFHPYSADTPGSNWRHMTPALCRQGCVLAVNLSFIFSSKAFEDKVNGWPASSTTKPDGSANQLKDGSGNVIPSATVISGARNRSSLVMGTVGGVGGLGGGSTFGIAPYCYNEQYWDTGAILTYSREVIFHEFGHCMGYPHESSMTYGDAWTRLGQELIRELGSTGQLPISNSQWETNYP